MKRPSGTGIKWKRVREGQGRNFVGECYSPQNLFPSSTLDTEPGTEGKNDPTGKRPNRENYPVKGEKILYTKCP